MNWKQDLSDTFQLLQKFLSEIENNIHKNKRGIFIWFINEKFQIIFYYLSGKRKY